MQLSVQPPKVNYGFAFTLTLYLSYVLILIKLATEFDNQIFILIGLGLIFLLNILQNSHKSDLFRINSKPIRYITLFYFFLFIIGTYNIGFPLRGVTRFTAFAIHIWMCYRLFQNKNAKNINNYIFAFFIISFFLVLIPHLLVVNSFKFGAFYNLVSPNIPTSNTVDAPLIVAILFLLAILDIFVHKNRSFLNVVSIILSVFTLLLFSRRGFIFSSFIAIFMYNLYTRFKRKIFIYLTFSFFLIPIFWDVISLWVVQIFKLDFLTSLIARSDTDELNSATGRMLTWQNVLQLFFSFKTKYIFGIPGGPPVSLFLESRDNAYTHAHNTFLQMFLEAGYFIDVFFILLLVVCLRQYFAIYSQKNKKLNTNFFILLLIFLFSLSGTESLILGVYFSNFIFCFVLVGFVVFNLRYSQAAV